MMGFFSKWSRRRRPDKPSETDPGTRHGSLEETRFRLEVESVLSDVRPMLQADGGDIELVGVVGRSARVKMTGACDGCASASLTLRLGIEKRLRDAIPGFGDLIPV